MSEGKKVHRLASLILSSWNLHHILITHCSAAFFVCPYLFIMSATNSLYLPHIRKNAKSRTNCHKRLYAKKCRQADLREKDGQIKEQTDGKSVILEDENTKREKKEEIGTNIAHKLEIIL